MVTWLRRWGARGAIAVAALLALGFGVGTVARNRPQADHPAVQQTVEQSAKRATGSLSSGGGGTAVTGLSVPGANTAEVETYAADAIQTTALPGLPDRVVRTADMSLRVRKSAFDTVWGDASRLATRLGGYVVSSNRGTPGPRPLSEDSASEPASGDLVIRVPAARFEEALAELRKLGVVLADTVQSQDVTQEFVDLESRLRNQRSQQSVLLRLMAQSRNVGETLAVQQQLAQVQDQIEQITGRLNALKTLTTLSTISLHLFEPGATGAPGPGDEGPSFSKAWDTAIEGLARIGTVILIGAIWLAPFAILAAIVLALRGRNRAPAATPQA